MPDNKNNHEYTVCILLNDAMNECLLVRKGRTAFKDKLNGIGGELIPGETPYECALREIREETGLEPEDLTSLGLVRLACIGTLDIPGDCKYQDGRGCTLYYYAGAVKPGSVDKIRAAAEPLEWHAVQEVLESGVKSEQFAGNGDLPYFVNAAYNAVLRFRPEHGICEHDPSDVIHADEQLVRSMNRARGNMDKAFRDKNLYEASRCAGIVSRLAYTLFYMTYMHTKGGCESHAKNNDAGHVPGPDHT